MHRQALSGLKNKSPPKIGYIVGVFLYIYSVQQIDILPIVYFGSEKVWLTYHAWLGSGTYSLAPRWHFRSADVSSCVPCYNSLLLLLPGGVLASEDKVVEGSHCHLNKCS